MKDFRMLVTASNILAKILIQGSPGIVGDLSTSMLGNLSELGLPKMVLSRLAVARHKNRYGP